LRMHCLVRYIVDGKVEGRTEVRGRLRRRSKKLLDGLKKKRIYCKPKDKAPDRRVWRTRCGRGYGAVVRQTTE